ncbi:tetratricopeptide repeat protein [Aeoliella sp. ICT_H6.2]|uniref:Tetratricopeptide repeat protein n=1 Tax=Aeoliella straminimaris TaxID=2954799 RepID=A0A9X2FB01_9BACT|nr:tetratricopeptide repeat protein [Aeoliella straminimaris]MCO6045540.1 tetratricopeptide repeat protein [Aeoliella straminimaris]
MRRLLCLSTLSLVAFGLYLGASGPVAAQPPAVAADSETDAEKTERITAERFLQLLKRRPRLGTALDKVYGYHVGRGTLDEFCESLEAEAKESNDGKLWMILGMVQMQRSQDTLAVSSLEKAQDLLPDEPLPSYYLGKSLVLLGEIDRAIEAMRTAIERKPPRADMLAVFQDLGRILQRTGRTDDAIGVWKELEALFPNDTQVQEEIARILAEEGALEAAIERYDRLVENTDDRFRRVEIAIRSAQLKAQLGQTEQSLREFETLLAKVNPDSWLHRDIRNRIEEVFWSSGDIDGLVNYYTDRVEEHPNDVDAMMRSAHFLSLQHRLPEAETWFRKAIEKAPSQSEPRLALVEALVTNDDYTKAALEMKELVELEPDNPDFIVRYGELVFNDSKRSKEQQQQEAVAIWMKLLDKRGDDAVTVSRVTDLLRGAGASDQAIEHYNKAIDLAPNEPQYREYLGEYLFQLGKKDQAVTVWEELAAGERETRDNLVRLSEVFSTFGLDNKALDVMKRACEMKPTFGHRARYAELLREAEQYDQALAQLDLAEPLADDPELRELVITERIKNYQGSGTLQDRIANAEDAVAGPSKEDPHAWQLLALLREADRRFQPACRAAEQATVLAPSDPGVWETAAMLQERSGQYGAAIESYRKLATIDRRFQSSYLQQIATLEMRVGNTDEALSAAEQLIASAPGNTEHYRFLADLCFRVGEEQRGYEVLRRCVRSNPNDEGALLHLAKVLADAFQTNEAIELYWRAFDLANDLDGKTAAVTQLSELYLRTNRFDALLDRLELTSREQKKTREGQLWLAAAHQAAGDLGQAKQLLEQLAREDSRDTKLLEQLVALARAEYDLETAAEYQKRLVAVAPSPAAEYQLANLLLEKGDIEQSEALWLKLSQRKSDPSSLSDAIDNLIQKQQLEAAAKLVDKAVAAQPNNWEVLGQAMIVYGKLSQNEKANRAAQQVLSMSEDPGEPTAKVKQAIERRAAGRNTNNYDPYAALGQPRQLVQAASQIKGLFFPGENDAFRYSGRSAYTPSCFQDVQAIAYCMPFVTADDDFDGKQFIDEFVEKALESGDADRLWRSVFYLVWDNPQVNYSANSEEMERCLEALISQDDAWAAQLMMQQFISQRQRQQNAEGGELEPLDDEQLDQLKQWCEVAKGSVTNGVNYYELMAASEFARADRQEQATKMIEEYINQARNSNNSGQALVQAVSLLMNDRYVSKPSKEIDEKAKQLLSEALHELKPTTSGSGGYGSVFMAFVEHLVEQDQLDSAIDSTDTLLHWQAEQTARMRPSQRERSQTGGQPISTHRNVNGTYVQVTIDYPPPSAYFSTEAIMTTYGLYESTKDDESKLQVVRDQLKSWADEESDDPYLRLARLMANASVAYWTKDEEEVRESLAAATELQVGGQFVVLAQTRLLYESGRVREALDIVEQLRPTNQKMLVDRELTILQLVLELGDLERAKQSAQKLFALRLDSATELKLADLMYQLGMQDLGDRMMARIRRRAGGKQDTLVELMTRYVAANKPEQAAEIARQVIRRTEPRETRNRITASNRQHEQAVRVLAQTKQLAPLIEQYEELVERSPKSVKLVNKLSAFYEAAGRRDDATSLRMKLAEVSPTDPRNLMAAAAQLAAANKHDLAVDKYLAALAKSPELLNNEYYTMRSSIEAADAWEKFAEGITKAGIGNFRQSYRLREVIDELARDKKHAAVNKMILAGVKELTLHELSEMLYSIARRDFEVSEELALTVTEKLESGDWLSSGPASFNYVYSRSSNGRTTGVVDGIAQIVSQDEALEKRTIESMRKHLEEDEAVLLPRVLLAMILIKTDQFDEAGEVMQPLIDKQNKSAQDIEAVWCLASELTHQADNPSMACDLLESLDEEQLAGSSNSGFEYTARSLLSYAYEKAGRRAESRRILLEELGNTDVDTQISRSNPGYGDYQYIRSQSGLARRFLDLKCPAEAFLAFQNAYGDEERLERAGRYGGNIEYERNRISERIAKETTSEAVVEIVESALRPAATESEDGTPDIGVGAYLATPEVKQRSLIDVRVTMPLEEFTEKIKGDEELRTAVSKWLDENSPADTANAMPLKSLVTWLMISNSTENQQQAELATEAIVGWMADHPESSNAADEKSSDTEEGQSQNDTATPSGDAKSDESALSDQLLLGMAALQLSEEVAESKDIIRMLERASAEAERCGEKSLATSLQCQIASRIAKDEPERARSIFWSTLDELLPPSDTPEENAASGT